MIPNSRVNPIFLIIIDCSSLYRILESTPTYYKKGEKISDFIFFGAEPYRVKKFSDFINFGRLEIKLLIEAKIIIKNEFKI